ncbi:MAG: sulfotransferase family 2 domain-containing protein [Caldilineaceae bacterium]
MTKPKAHFLHIGKTGGTAVQQALEPHLHAGKYAIVLEPHATRLADVPPGEALFFLLRHPVTRFVSGFNSRLRQGLPFYHQPWCRGEAEAFACFRTPNELAEALTDPDDLWRGQAQRAMRTMQHVNDSVWRWLHNPTYFAARQDDVIFVGFQESLTADFQRLCQVLELDAQITLPTDPVAANLAPNLANQAISALGRRNLLAYYAKDVEFYEEMQSKLRCGCSAQA